MSETRPRSPTPAMVPSGGSSQQFAANGKQPLSLGIGNCPVNPPLILYDLAHASLHKEFQAEQFVCEPPIELWLSPAPGSQEVRSRSRTTSTSRPAGRVEFGWSGVAAGVEHKQSADVILQQIQHGQIAMQECGRARSAVCRETPMPSAASSRDPARPANPRAAAPTWPVSRVVRRW